jgi:hypothetical protein
LVFYDKKSKAKWNFIKKSLNEHVDSCESQQDWDMVIWSMGIQIANDLIEE